MALLLSHISKQLALRAEPGLKPMPPGTQRGPLNLQAKHLLPKATPQAGFVRWGCQLHQLPC